MSKGEIAPSQFQLISIGSNQFVNCRGTISLDGEEQVKLERGSNDGQLLATIDLFDSTGTLIAKFRRNAWAFAGEPTYEVTTSPSNLSLTKLDTGEVVFVAEVVNRNEISVTRADLYGKNGTYFYVGMATVQRDGQDVETLAAVVNGITASGNRKVNCPTGIEVTQSGFKM